MRVLNGLLLMSLLTTLHATEESMETLLKKFETKSDLSLKTKIANAGNSIIITREELERMQVRKLKDLINSLNLLNYAESRFGFTDPNYVTNTYPFSSNAIRVYIDDQEVSSSAYGSGLFYLGDIELGFVNHVEVYTINPSFQYATESANFLIKIYSKVAERDRGTKIDMTLGTRGYHQKSLQHIDRVNGISYLTYFSHLQSARKKHKSFGSPLSRDKNRLFFFNKISMEKQALQLQWIDSSRDAFMGISQDAVTQKAKLETDYYHVGYQNQAIDNLKLSVVLEKGDIGIDFKDKFQSLAYAVDDKLATFDAQYRLDTFDDNDLIIGTKHRYKSFVMSSDFHKMMPVPVDYDEQIINSFYVENHYTLSPQWLFSLGTQVGKITNNATVKDQDLWMSRVGLVYSDAHWVSKTFLHYASVFAEPYLYLHTLPKTNQAEIGSETISSFTQEFSYAHDQHALRAVLGYRHIQNPLIIRKDALENSPEIEQGIFTEFDYRYAYTQNTLGKIGLAYQNRRNPATDYQLDNFKEYKAVAMLSHRQGKFDTYQRLLYNRNNFINKDFLDYGVGLKYHYNKHLKFSLRGNNLLNKARQDYFERGRREMESGNWKGLEPLYISPIDQEIQLTMEYFF